MEFLMGTLSQYPLRIDKKFIVCVTQSNRVDKGNFFQLRALLVLVPQEIRKA